MTSQLVQAATETLRKRLPPGVKTALVLGSGLGSIATAFEPDLALDYSEIPGFRPTTAAGHVGRLTCGRCEGQRVLLLEGRSHLYEGASAELATLPVNVLAALGVERLILTNAAGGLHPALGVGDIVVLHDGINQTFANPLIPEPDPDPATTDDPSCSPQDKSPLVSRDAAQHSHAARLLNLASLFDPELSAWALEAARQAGVPASPGVYVAVRGPNYETRAEQRLYRWLGADVIGMSTLPEAIVAAALGLRVLGLSTVTNCCRPDAALPTDGDHVVLAARHSAERVLAIVRGVIRRCTPG